MRFVKKQLELVRNKKPAKRRNVLARAIMSNNPTNIVLIETLVTKNSLDFELNFPRLGWHYFIRANGN